MWRKRNRRRREQRPWQRSVIPLEAAGGREEMHPAESAFTPLELDFFRRAEELYLFEPGTDLEADPA